MFLRARPKVEKKRKERKKGEGGSWNACFHILTYLKKHFFPVSLQRKLKMSYVRGEGGGGGGGLFCNNPHTGLYNYKDYKTSKQKLK